MRGTQAVLSMIRGQGMLSKQQMLGASERRHPRDSQEEVGQRSHRHVRTSRVSREDPASQLQLTGCLPSTGRMSA